MNDDDDEVDDEDNRDDDDNVDNVHWTVDMSHLDSLRNTKCISMGLDYRPTIWTSSWISIFL